MNRSLAAAVGALLLAAGGGCGTANVHHPSASTTHSPGADSPVARAFAATIAKGPFRFVYSTSNDQDITNHGVIDWKSETDDQLFRNGIELREIGGIGYKRTPTSRWIASRYSCFLKLPARTLLRPGAEAFLATSPLSLFGLLAAAGADIRTTHAVTDGQRVVVHRVSVRVSTAANVAPEPLRSGYALAAAHGPQMYTLDVAIGADGLVEDLSAAYGFVGRPTVTRMKLTSFGSAPLPGRPTVSVKGCHIRL